MPIGLRALSDDLVAAMPGLRMFAVSLSGKRDIADDLVQETMIKAWAHQDRVQQGANVKAALYAILCNEFSRRLRERGHEVEDVDGLISSRISVPPEQEGHLDLADLRTVLKELPSDQREAVVLVGAAGLSYEEVADICKVRVSTIKSRVRCGRSKLREYFPQ